MNKALCSLIVALLISLYGLSVDYTWVGTTSTAWNTTTNWSPAGIPGTGDNVTINNAALGNQPLMPASKTVTNFTISAGTLNLGGFTLSATGTSICSGGTLNTGTFSPNTAGSVIFSGTVFNSQVTAVAANLYFNGGSFNGATNQFTQTGATLSTSNGGCTFAGVTSNTFTNSGTGEIRMGNVSPDIFNGPVSFVNSNVGLIWVGYASSNNQFNQNITVSSTGEGAICLGNDIPTGSCQLASGKTITAGTFTLGSLSLSHFTQLGTTAQTINLTGTSFLYFGECILNGSITTNSPVLDVNMSTFNGTTNQFTINSLVNVSRIYSGDFYGTTTIINNGVDLFFAEYFGNVYFHGTAIIHNNGSGNIQFQVSGGGVFFNGNVQVNSIGSGNIDFVWAQLAATRTITTPTFSSGNLRFFNFTQLGTQAQTLSLTGTSSLYFFNASSTTFNGPLTASAPNLFLNGGTYNGATNQFTQTGSAVNVSTGGCNFAGATSNSIINSGTGEIRMGNTTADIFNGPAVFSNTNSGTINVGYTALNNQFNQNITLTSTGTGSINFGQGTGTSTLATGKTISTSTFSAGNLRLRNFTQTGTTAQTLTLTGSSIVYYETGTTFNGSLTSSSPNLFLNGSTFNGAVNELTQTGSTLNVSSGGCTFAGVTFNTVKNTGTGEIRMGNVNPDIFNGPAIFYKTSSGPINVAYNSLNNQFNDNITVTSAGLGSIRFGQGTGTSVLADGKTITGSSFISGGLYLRNFTQTGTTAQNITVTGTASIYFQPGTTFNGSLTASSPNLYFNGSTFNGAANAFTQTGSLLNTSTGGNSFSGSSSNAIINTGTGEIRMGNTNPDIFNGPAIFNITNSGTINVGINALNNQFNDDIELLSTGTGSINFGQGSGTSILADTKQISVVNTFFSSGTLRLRNFTQIGLASHLLNLTGSASLYFETGTTFNGGIAAAAPNLFLNGSTFTGGELYKTGNTLNSCVGGNTFNGYTWMYNTGTGELRMANTNADIFNETVHFYNFSSGTINVGYNALNNQFNNNILLTSGGAGSINFGQGSGTCILANSRTLSVNTFSSGSLRLRNFTQIGSTMQNISLSGSGNLYFETGTTFNGQLLASTPNLFLNGSVFNDNGVFTQTGNSVNTSLGGNTFNGSCSVYNTGTGEIRMGNVNPDIFNGQAYFDISSSGTINIGYNALNNQLNDNTFVYSSGTGTVGFGQGVGTSSLASGKTIAVFAFSSGALRFRNFTQTGTTAQSFSLTGSADIYFETGTTFNGQVTCESPNIYFNGSTFNDQASFLKTGNFDNLSVGGNVFNGLTTIENTSTFGSAYLGLSSSDYYYGHIHYTGVGYIYPAYTTQSYYFKDIYTTPLTSFGAGGGTVSLNGSFDQTFYADFVTPTTMTYLDVQSSSICSFVGKAEVTAKLSFISGYVDATETEPLTLTETATIPSPPSDASHSIGYIQKIGNTPFDFPTGNGSYLLPISISAPNDVTDAFTAKYIDYSSHPVYSHYLKEPTLGVISDCHYWNLNRDAGSSEVYVTISWNNAYHMCQVTDPGDLVVAHWNAGTSIWEDYGNGGTTGSVSDGTITSAFALTNYSPITLASTTGINPLPIELLSFTAEGNLDQVDLKWITSTEHNNDYFTVERSKDGIHFESIGTVNSKAVNGNSSQKLEYSLIDDDPYNGIVYYRLKQTDFDGVFEYSNIVSVTKNEDLHDLRIYPNPNNGIFQLEFTSYHSGVAMVEINSSRGEKIGMKKLELNAGTQTKELNFSELPKGVYFLNVTVNDQKITRKLVIH